MFHPRPSQEGHAHVETQTPTEKAAEESDSDSDTTIIVIDSDYDSGEDVPGTNVPPPVPSVNVEGSTVYGKRKAEEEPSTPITAKKIRTVGRKRLADLPPTRLHLRRGEMLFLSNP